MKTALVLSAGGMYGAYQAGAWKALSAVFQPDLVVGASIGALNGWAIAGGCPPGQLVDRWLSLDAAARYRWTAPRSVFGGILDAGPLRDVIRQLHAEFQPRTEFALVVTDLLKLEPRLFTGGQVTWRHLAASTAIIGIFDQLVFRWRLALGASHLGCRATGRAKNRRSQCSAQAARHGRPRLCRGDEASGARPREI
jgi:predicted acylesterase/phospholipase RssA